MCGRGLGSRGSCVARIMGCARITSHKTLVGYIKM